MSVVGIDFGTLYSQIGVCRRGGVDVIANEVSSRDTTNIVSFGEKERLLGEPAVAQQVLAAKDTIGQFKRLIGRKFSAKAVQQELKTHFSHNKTTELPDGNVGFEVNYQGRRQVFSPTQVAAMMLTKLKRTTETETQNTLRDVVIAVPGYWTTHQRREFLNATSIPGLNCLRLVNEHTAVAVNYGLFKTDLPEDKPMNVMFVDVGFANTTVSVVAFTKNTLEVKAAEFDSNFGGRDLDMALATHLVDAIKEKYKIDVRTNTRAWMRVLTGCEKVKKTLSANPQAPLNLECLMEDKDVRMMVTRDTLEELCNPHFDRLRAVIKRAIDHSGIALADIAAVEVVGGSIRVPAVQRVIAEETGKTLRFTMNAAEAVARGAALTCAIISPAFRVREYKITDLSPFPVVCTIRKLSDDKTIEVPVIDMNSKLPVTKLLPSPYFEPIDIAATYTDSPYLEDDAPRLLGRYTIAGPLPAVKDGAEATMKVKVRLNIHGIVELDQAQVEEKFEELVPKDVAPKKDAAAGKKEEKKKEAGPKAGDEGPAGGDAAVPNGTPDVEMKDDTAPPAAAEGDAMETAPEVEMVKKQRTRKHDVAMSGGVECLTKVALVQAHMELERKMQEADLLFVQTAEAKNSVEAYLLSMRGRIQDDLYDFVDDATRESFSALCTRTEDWLYEDGENETKDVYVQKLNELRAIGEPVIARKTEAAKRAEDYAHFQEVAAKFRQTLTAPDYDHIDAADKDKVAAECSRLEGVLAAEMDAQAQLPKHQDPKLWSSFIRDKTKELERFCQPILSKPKPKPEPKPESKPEEGMDAAKEDAPAPAPAAPEGEGEKMDMDEAPEQ
eukprot:CAMPEP_0177663784 /NCGR_PEP_ID=MMETSP0447-20121125/20113_1 /TAXON_ID=0 /ORGANISM="Stygamoeba regulata, Strain BSH-02190019" /LENGTH=835 /DNA_ID=CAMNT_0019169649 /DNA_START=17 /DNA_END=2524 /DNA_ORIENTATION=-